MIQRIQTVYLLIVAGLFSALLFLPLALVQSGVTLYSFDVFGLNTVIAPITLAYPTWSLLAIAGVIIILSFVILFLYKRRVLQIRMCVYNALLIIGFCILVGFYLWRFAAQLPEMKITFRIWAAFPIIALILDYLALRNIGADEILVRSLERLR